MWLTITVGDDWSQCLWGLPVLHSNPGGTEALASRAETQWFSSSVGRFVGRDWNHSRLIQNESKGYYLEIKQQRGHIICVIMYTQLYTCLWSCVPTTCRATHSCPSSYLKTKQVVQELRSLDPYCLLLRSMWCEHWGHLERTGGGLGKGYINRSGDIQLWCKVTKNTRMTLGVLNVCMFYFVHKLTQL